MNRWQMLNNELERLHSHHEDMGDDLFQRKAAADYDTEIDN